MGAVRLRGSAWILPETAETKELFEWLAQEVQSVRGEATLLRVERIETMRDEQVTALFHTARAEEYEDVVRGSREVLAQLDRAKSAHRASFAQVRAKLEGLKRELDRIESIDHLESPAGRRAHELWERTARRLTAAEARPVAGSGRQRASTLPAPGSTWVTRPRPHIDRIASAWLIKWFFDAQAKFAFADAADAPKKGVPFDILGAEFGHHGEDCGAEAKDVTVPSHRAPGGRTMRKTTTALAFLVAWFVAMPVGWAQKYDDKEHAELAKALKAAKVSLQSGLQASARAGKPISAKFEVDQDHLQLSIYTMKGTTFSEVIVDHTTGKVAKVDPLTSAEDLTAAKAQAEAMAKAKRSLAAAASEAVKANKGYRAVSVMPELKDGHPVAEVTLVKGAEWKTESEKLD